MWLIAHSLVLTGLSAAALIGAPLRWIAEALVAEACVAFFFLFVEGGVPARRVANAVTGFRLVTGVGAVAATAFGVLPPTTAAWAIFWALVMGEITDFLDGFIARRAGPTAFGARLDMETDAFFMLALSMIAVAWHGFPRWIIVTGLLRYAVALPFFLLPDSPFPRSFSAFARTASATAAIALLVVVFPRSPDLLRTIGGVLAVVILALSFGWEAVLRVAAAARGRGARPDDGVGGRSSGLVRSFLVYYGVPFRLLGMKRFYRRFVNPDDLVFDVGAHVGNRVRALRSLGARVIAIEPQASCVRLLNRLYGEDPDVFVEAVACGAENGTATLRVDPDHPTLATLSDEWIRSIDRHYGDLDIRWEQRESVSVRTLDDLVDEYGVPAFIKIDVEGFEAEALRGLHRSIRAISFEFLPASPDSALASVDEIRRIGSYRFNYSMIESMRFASPEWLTADELRGVIRDMAHTGRSGDVYAVLEETGQ